MVEGEEVALNGKTPKERLITTLQYRINEARNNHQKVTTIFVSTLSECMMMLKDEETTNICDRAGTRIFACEKCGYGLDDIFIHDEFNYPIDPVYCPNCGRKIEQRKDDADE